MWNLIRTVWNLIMRFRKYIHRPSTVLLKSRVHKMTLPHDSIVGVGHMGSSGTEIVEFYSSCVELYYFAQGVWN